MRQFKKTPLLFLLLFLSLTFSTLAKDYFIQYRENSAPNAKVFIAQLDAKTAAVSLQKEVGISANSEKSFLISQKNSRFVGVLLIQSGYDEVVLYHKRSLQEAHRIRIAKVKVRDISGLKISPITLSNDDSKLLVISQKDNKQAIYIYDIKTSAILFKRNLGSTPFQISLSADKNYLLLESLRQSKPLFIAVDIKHNKTSTILNLGQLSIKTHVFQHSLFVSTMRSPKRNKYFTLSRIDFSNNKKFAYKDKSLTHFVFRTEAKTNNLYISGADKKNKKLFVLTIAQDLAKSRADYGKKLKPLSMALNQDNSSLLVVGKRKLASINLQQQTLKSFIRIGFDARDGILNKAGNLAYIQENLGSQVALFDLKAGKKIDSSNAGRVFNQALVVARKIMIGGSLIELIMLSQNSTKNILLDNSEKKLFVINDTTNDLTLFDAKTLKKLNSLATGFKTYFIYQGKKPQTPILVVGKNRISLIDFNSNKAFLILKDAKLIALDQTNDVLFYQLNKQLHSYDMRQKHGISLPKTYDVLAVLPKN